jgi:hypothetical protein
VIVSIVSRASSSGTIAARAFDASSIGTIAAAAAVEPASFDSFCMKSRRSSVKCV